MIIEPFLSNYDLNDMALFLYDWLGHDQVWLCYSGG